MSLSTLFGIPDPFIDLGVAGIFNSGGQASSIYNPNGNSDYNVASASEMANNPWVNRILDFTGLAQGFWNDLTGVTAQSREFQQQEYLMEKEQAYKDPVYQMERMRAAGINGNLAASGIAGSPQSASPSQVSPSMDVAGGVGAAAQGLQAVNSSRLNSSMVRKNDADAEQALAIARNQDMLANAQMLSSAGEFAKNLTSSGLAEIEAIPLALKFIRNGLDGFQNVFNAQGLCRKFDYEMDLLQSQYNTEQQRYRMFEEQANLYVSEEELIASKKAHEDILKDIDNQKLKLIQKYEELAADSDFGIEFAFFRNHPEGSPEYKAFMTFYKDKFYNQELGKQNAEVIKIYNKVFNTLKAEAEWQPFLDMLEEKKEVTMKTIDALYGITGGEIGTIINIFKYIGHAAGYSESGLHGMDGSDVIKEVTAPKENGANLDYGW